MFARTERLLLRPGWAEDAPALAAAIAHESVVRQLATAPWPYDRHDAKAWLAAQRPVHEPHALIFRRTRAEPQLIGAIGLTRASDGVTELGYWIAPSHWGLGFATEAGRAMIAAARDGLRLPALRAWHFADNPASGRVLDKLGFKATGIVDMRRSGGRALAAPSHGYALDMRRVATAIRPAQAPSLAARGMALAC